ncbi:hypothetical protein Mapa_014610 [Marchantia paleacea]|nr:hypothetical protein Mapa_014610 [Marchantia paleacea]
MDMEIFDVSSSKIKHHRVFYIESNHTHMSMWMQVEVALDRFGHYKNAEYVSKCMMQWGIGRGTVCLLTARVMEAIHDYMVDEVHRPDQLELIQISAAFARNEFTRGALILWTGLF